jgi:hypothetical protein
MYELTPSKLKQKETAWTIQKNLNALEL